MRKPITITLSTEMAGHVRDFSRLQRMPISRTVEDALTSYIGAPPKLSGVEQYEQARANALEKGWNMEKWDAAAEWGWAHGAYGDPAERPDPL